MGKEVTGSAFASALEGMVRYQRALEELFSKADVVLTPMTAAPPPRIDDAETVSVTAELVRLNHQWSLGHVPALSLPCGFTSTGLPVAIQLAARKWDEASLLRLGAAYQRVTDWHRERPPVVRDL
jgi:Asp-tRNA(Asn)/Glu-tRNA(Gln) amidotransferase A subunit family amidase